MPETTQLVVDDREIELSNPDKPLFPTDGLDKPITKADLVDYYRRVAEVMVPHMRGRPLVMDRYPDGITGDSFYQKDISEHFPDWIHRAEVAKQDGTVTHVLCDDAATLTYVATQACITPHLWLSRSDRIDHPDRMIFDLDPSAPGFDPVRFAAGKLDELLREIGLVPFVQTTGSKGLHVIVPLDRRDDFDAVRDFARSIGRVLADRHPDRLTVEQRKAKRGDRVYLDTMRNAYAQSAVAPYAVRARPTAPIATPLDWDEVGDSKLDPQRYTVHNIFRRLGQRQDPCADIDAHATPLGDARRKFERLSEES